MILRPARWLTAAGAIWMLAFIAWLPFEDTETWTALLLAAAACIWLGLRRLVTRESSSLWSNLAAGGLMGAATPLLAITLMGIKSGLHAHGFADFTARQVWEVLNLIPIGAIIGLVVGLGISAAKTR